MGATGKLHTEEFDKANSASQIRWKFELLEVDSPGTKLKKVWDRVNQWMLTNDHQTVKYLEEMSISAFKISYDEEICRYETEEGEYDH